MVPVQLLERLTRVKVVGLRLAPNLALVARCPRVADLRSGEVEGRGCGTRLLCQPGDRVIALWRRLAQQTSVPVVRCTLHIGKYG